MDAQAWDRIAGAYFDEISTPFQAEVVNPLFYERACQEQTSTSAAGQGSFHGQLAPSPSGVACVPKLPQLFSLRATAVIPLGSPGYFSFRFLPLVVLPETLSLLRLAWLADWVAVCQPGFYWRLEAYSYLRSCEGAYS